MKTLFEGKSSGTAVVDLGDAPISLREQSTMLAQDRARTTFHYALRRTLPPWSWRRNLDELLEFCANAGVEEVILKVDTEEFSHGQYPIHLLEEYLPTIETIAKELRDAGIIYSLNPWVTLLHMDRGYFSEKTVPGMQNMVGHDGTQTRAVACPLCEVWREHTAKLWSIYASTRPHVIWVEDDIRTFNHMPVRFGCFCPLHLRRFAERIGQSVAREELVAAILLAGDPHPWRAQWLDLQGEIMAGVWKLLAEAVQKVSPETQLGLMSSGPANHALEGRDWEKLATIFTGTAGNYYSRPPLGNYEEAGLRGLYYSATSIRQTRRAVGGNPIELTEVENVPFTLPNKSVAFTRLQIMLSAACGCEGASLNLFDHLGNNMAYGQRFGEMLAQTRPWLDAVRCALAGENAPVFEGVGVVQHPRASYGRQLAVSADYGEMADDGYLWAQILEGCGLATTWDYEHSRVVALCGQTVAALENTEIERLLSSSVLCDAPALRALERRGFGHLTGIREQAFHRLRDLGAVAAEEFIHEDFGGSPGLFASPLLPDYFSDAIRFLNCTKTQGAFTLGRLVDVDRRPVADSLLGFENECGGRVISWLYDVTQIRDGATFLSAQRMAILRSCLRWLNHHLPFSMEVENDVPVLPLCLRTSNGDTLYFVFCLSIDALDGAAMRIQTPQPDQAELLLPDGSWKHLYGAFSPTDSSCTALRVHATFDEPLVVRALHRVAPALRQP